MSASPVIFKIFLLITAFLCTVVFGKMLVFQTVVMPGIAKLDDGAYLRAFQVIDGIIQGNEPIFVFFWFGSVISIVSTCIYGIVLDASGDNFLATPELIGLSVATLAWLVCQWTTITINVPRNNRVKVLDLVQMVEEKAYEREYFEATWLKWHLFRTVLFGLVSIFLLVLLLLL
mmetsp:Transcript_27757/g.81500  ORF Transcript_27757/g.81500 Transcript_27757/m.81500 type:complete len:174 (-) Transcript_27757:108-629(-)